MLETRNQDLTNLNRSADLLGRALRENVELHTMDSTQNQAKFVTESGELLTCSYAQEEDGSINLTNFNVNRVEKIMSSDYIDNLVKKNISSFVRGIRDDNYSHADKSFSDVLQSFENRNKIEDSRDKFQAIQERFKAGMEITSTPQWKKLNEVSLLLNHFLKENKEKVMQFEDVVNGVKLCNAVSTAFKMSPITLKELKEGKNFHIPSDANKTLYDMLCQQELIRKEILESKADFAQAWAGNTVIQNLANCIYAERDVIRETLCEAIKEIPYLALATKAELTNVFESVFKIVATTDKVITKKDVREFVHTVFESKKPAKTQLLSTLSEKYGLNVQSLKFTPSFSGLSKAQSVVFEVLAKITKEEGVLHDVLVEFSTFLRKKGGVQVLDVNDFLTEAFNNSEMVQLSENGLMAQYINLPKLKADLQALKILVGGGDAGMEGAAGMEGDAGMDPSNPIAPEDAEPPLDGEEDVASDEMTQQGTDSMTDEYPPEGAGEVPPEAQGDMPPEALGDDSEAAQPGMDVEPGMEGDPAAAIGGGGDAASLVADLEALIQSLGGPGGGLEGEEGAPMPFQKGDTVPSDGVPPEEGGGEAPEEGGGPPPEEGGGEAPEGNGKKPFPPKKGKKPFPPK